MQYTKPRGTVDLYGKSIQEFRLIEDLVREYARVFNFQEIKTPIFESRELFTKAVGTDSDIVHKEFYDFKDKGDRNIALRPEGTAGTIRAIVENKLLENSNYPIKFFYFGPMFRYDRPQSGRQRQFHQFGVECVGNFQISDEINMLVLANAIISACKINKYVLEINNLGSAKSRALWIKELKEYFKKYKDKLSNDSKLRLETNPLRILDDKEDGKKDFVINAPKLNQFLTEEENKYFEQVKTQLDFYKINYTINLNLVRGLDYYSGLVFEFISTSDKLKGQSTLIGGGGYSSLVAATGGKDVPGFGFALGVERFIIAINDENPNFFHQDNNLNIVFAPLDAEALKISFLLQNILRLNGYSSDFIANTFELKKHFKFAEFNKCKYVIIIGKKEIDEKVVIIKDQNNKKETKIKFDDVLNYFKKNIGDYSEK